MVKIRLNPFVSFLIIIVLLGLMYLLFVSFTPKILTKDSTSIAEKIKLEVNDTTQHLTIRGYDITNPIILFVHGGPGVSDMPLVRKFNAELEKYFVVVTWDQRGAGQSNPLFGAVDGINISQFVQDGKVVSEYLINRFEQEKVILLGHSWGTLLGTEMAIQYPEYYSAYIGVGQVVDTTQGEKLTYQILLDRAEAEHNQKALDELAEINSPPYLTYENNPDFFSQLGIHRKWVKYYGGATYDPHAYNGPLIYTFSNEYSLLDVFRFLRGGKISAPILMPEIMKFDYLNNPPQYQIPVYFLQGTHDLETPTQLVQEFYKIIEAPEKAYYGFEFSGHTPQFEESDRFNQLIIELLGNTN